jgi:hypothetical protein
VIHANNFTAPDRRSLPVPQPLFRYKNSRPGQVRRITGNWRSFAVGCLGDGTTVEKSSLTSGERRYFEPVKLRFKFGDTVVELNRVIKRMIDVDR